MNTPQLADEDVLRQFRLDGRVAFLSGATGHLGRSMAEALAGAGAHVVLNARRGDRLDTLCAELRSHGRKVSAACFDVTDDAAVSKNMALIGT